MSIIDAFKNSVLEGFNTTISGSDIVFSMSAALLCSLFMERIFPKYLTEDEKEQMTVTSETPVKND